MMGVQQISNSGRQQRRNNDALGKDSRNLLLNKKQS